MPDYTIVTNRAYVEELLMAVLQEATNGRVLKGRHVISNPSDWQTFAKEQLSEDDADNSRVNYWEFFYDDREDIRSGTEGIPLGKHGVRYTYKVFGRYSFDTNTGSEDSFNNIVDSIMDALAGTIRPGSVVSPTRNTTVLVEAATADLDLDMETYGEALHTAAITVSWLEHVTRTT